MERSLKIIILGLMLCFSSASAQDSLTACPREVYFWADQCEGYRADICPDGMRHLAREVMNRSNVWQWRMSDGSFETKNTMAALSDSALVTALCEQLQGREDFRDRAEAEYLALLLNISAGALPLEATISRDIKGDIGRLMNSFEEALNQSRDLDTWQQIVDQVNSGNIDAPRCDDPDQIFKNVTPCGN